MNKFYDCPRCGQKHCAKRSQAYPQIVVHKCDGQTLYEVASYDNGKIIPVKFQPEPKPIYEIKTHMFRLEKIQNEQTLLRYNRELKNEEVYANHKNFLKNGSVWIAKRRSSGEALYMIYVQNKTIPSSKFFSGVSVMPVSQLEGEDILKALIDYGILNKNPFPLQYRVGR